MSVERVRAYLAQYDRAKDVREFEVSSATVALAAQALSVEPARIAKTLSFYGDEQHPCLLVVAAGDAKVDNAKFKGQFGHKARMIAAPEVEALTGHAPGGVCPFANPEGVYTVLDVSLKRFATVFPACGSGNSAIEMDMQTLYQCARAQDWVDVCKGWQQQA